MEYIVIPGINDQPSDVQSLIKFIEGTSAKVNLIPLNAPEDSKYQSASAEDLDKFRNKLVDAGVLCFSRKKKGDNIQASCGQLAT